MMLRFYGYNKLQRILRPGLDKIKRLGAQSITGAFQLVALTFVESEAGIFHWTKRRDALLD